MTKTGEAARPLAELDADSLFDTLRLRQREIGIGLLAMATLAVGIWLWRSSVAQKQERGERALALAANSYYSGNVALAKTDLEKVVERYSGTPAGTQGAMLLAQVLFDGREYDAGIKRLESAKGSAGSGSFQASLDALTAAGYADELKYDEAVRRYLAAADKSSFVADKDLYRAEAARILSLAGKPDDARKIWTDIALRNDSPVAGEAKIRLGELDAKPAK